MGTQKGGDNGSRQGAPGWVRKRPAPSIKRKNTSGNKGEHRLSSRRAKEGRPARRPNGVQEGKKAKSDTKGRARTCIVLKAGDYGSGKVNFPLFGKKKQRTCGGGEKGHVEGNLQPPTNDVKSRCTVEKEEETSEKILKEKEN